MRLLITGAGFENKGAEAMLGTVRQQLATRLPQAELALLPMPNELAEAERQGFVALRNPSNRLTRAWQLTRAYLRQPASRPLLRSHPRVAYHAALAGPLAGVLDLAGFLYTDDGNLAAATYAAGWVRYGTLTGCPVIFMPQAWGPFSNPAIAAQVKTFAQATTYARDEESQAYLAGLLGASQPIPLAPDIALRFVGSPAAVGARLLAELPWRDATRPLLVLAPNARIVERGGGDPAASPYLSVLAELARQAIDQWQARVLIVPHDVPLQREKRRDDRVACRALAARVAAPGQCLAIDQWLSAADTMSLLAQAELIVGSRYHSLVLGLSAGVPAVALGWSHKYEALLRLVGREQQVLNHEGLTPAALLAIVAEAWAQRARDRGHLALRLPALRAAVDQVFDQVVARLTERLPPAR